MQPFSRPDIDEFFRAYAITTFAVNSDETKIAFSTNLSGKFNLWGMDLDSPYPYPLTYIDQTPHYVKFSPNGDYLLVGFDQDGDENIQMYLLPPAGGALTPLRTAPGRRHYFASLSKDGKRVYYTSDKENHTYLNGYVYDMEAETEEVLYVGEGAATYVAEVAADESSYVVVKAYANTFMPAFVHIDGEFRSLTPNADHPHVVDEVVYVDNTLVFSTNYGTDRTYLAQYELATGEFRALLQLDDADIEKVQISPSSQRVFVVASAGVEDRLYEYDLAAGTSRQLELPVDIVESMRVTESGSIYVLGRGDTVPFNLYVRNGEGTWTPLTSNRVMGMTKEQLVQAEVLTYPSFDGLEIESLWFAAHPETANGYTVVWPHGGPQSSERRMFRPFFQYLCNRGYNVWAPNFRGSSGYGAKFMKMVEGDWGYGPRLDMVESLEWLIGTGRASRDKLFLVGGSYGGYMTLLLHGRHADYFQACVDIFGPSNLFTFVDSVPEHWKPMMKQWLGDAVEDKERLTVDSPITYLDQMTKPMLVIQGANDPRVIKAESDQIVAALRGRGSEVEYLVFEDEGHGFMKKANEITAYKRVVEFLDQYRA